MFRDKTVIAQFSTLHTLIIVMQGTAIHGRGVLLLNASETESRIKHLDGFVSVSFFVNETQETIAEYVQWRSPAHLANAFRQPAFFEHVRVLETLVSAEVGFYSVERVIAREDVVIGPLFSGVVDMQILTLPKENMDASIARIEQWADAAPQGSKSLRAVVVHADRGNAKAALFIHHGGVPGTPVWYVNAEIPEIARGARMTRYATVAAPPATERAMQYVMSATLARKEHGP